MTGSFPTTAPAHRSFSQKSSLLWCGEQYRLTRVARAPEMPSFWLVGGKAVHAACEALNHHWYRAPGNLEPNHTWIEHLWNQSYASEIREQENLSQIPQSEWRAGGRKSKDKPNAEDGEFWKVAGLGYVKSYVDFLQRYNLTIATFAGEPAIEMDVTATFGDVLVKGYLDVVFDLGGELLVCDIKGLDENTPIATPTGWATMKSLRVGDEVFGSDGSPCKVTAKSPTKQLRCYRVKFDDGTSIVCDEEHLWETTTGGHRKETSVKNVQEISQRLFDVATGQRDQRIKMPMPLSLPFADLPIDPYVLGVWLGDGKARGGSFTQADDEVPNEIRARGHEVTAWKVQPGRCQDYNVVGLHRALRQAGLVGDKHVPLAYLRAAESQRLDLLRGLMDTDGTWHRTRRQAVFCSTDKALSDAVRELAWSLGERPSANSHPVTGFGVTTTAHTVTWSPRVHVPFAMPRKVALVELARPAAKCHRRLIVSVAETISVPTVCISVDSIDSTYLAGEQMVPTHNTGSRTPESTEQLGLYANMLQKNLGVRPTLGSYWMARKGEWEPPSTLDQWTEEHFVHDFKVADQMIREELFLPSVGSKCKTCGVSDYCKSYGGTKADLFFSSNPTS